MENRDITFVDAVIATIRRYGDPEATAEVAARVSDLPQDSSFLDAVAAVAREVWERKLARATVRADEANRKADALAAMNALPPSKTIQ